MSTGADAENAVTDLLKRSGHKIIFQNWRTTWCEMDIISQKNMAVYFTEVKYRHSDGQGEGFDYITPKKLAKLRLGVRSWQAINGWPGEVRLQVASVSGHEYQNIEIIELT